MAEQIVPPTSDHPRAFGLLPSVALQNSTSLDCRDLIDLKSQHVFSIIQAVRALLRADPGYPVDSLLENAEYAVCALIDAADALGHLERRSAD